MGTNQVTAQSTELLTMMQHLCRFQQSALSSTVELEVTIIPERGARRLDLTRQSDRGDVSQLCQFVGGEGGTGKWRIIEALVALLGEKGISNQLLITATSGTAVARINGITIHSACGFTKDQGVGANMAKELDGVRLLTQADRFVHGQSRMDWQEKDVLVIDEVSMLGARTLHAVSEQLCWLRRSHSARCRAAAPARQGACAMEEVHDSRHAGRANARRRRSGAIEASEAGPIGRVGRHGSGPPQLEMLPGRQADPLGDGHHRGDTAEQEPM
ncbi:ATP-dependent DNA helicase PIF1 [Tolypocladium ophioglossoides CBS 100239]|uniref:ATP-dependent DNA helicase PIF1 n=1 Tax=Tolypocladium ophioglossoides (strain CBS 100239) TaxID=1163406 RepID=A0A0L0MXU0_TOLOC|nr:ATP-dependent DNA helicase PIF1 [Tolypocladium ophioglossoides CBS 100239]